MATVHIRIESERGCGFRQPGGIYLICDGPGASCDRFPVQIDVCPTCHSGIKPSRGFTWINPAALLGLKGFTDCGADLCAGCPVNGSIERAGLIWIGEKFYPRPANFTAEAQTMGISRRIPNVPKDFEVGQTWVLFAHRKGISEFCPVEFDDPKHPDDCECEGTGVVFHSAIFHAARPQRIEYVITGNESEEELDALEERGFTLVKIVRDTGPTLFQDDVIEIATGVAS